MKLTPEIYFEHVPRVIDMSIRSELYYVNEFTFAVAVILSAQATDKKVNEVTPALFDIAATPDEMLVLGENGLREHIKVISFFNNKAKNIIDLAERLSDTQPAPLAGRERVGLRAKRVINPWVGQTQNNPTQESLNDKSLTDSIPPRKGGAGRTNYKFPIEYHDQKKLMSLPGIGQKTANVIMNVLWDFPLLGVDTHVFRNAHRYGWVTDADNTPEKVEAKLMKLIPKKYHGMVNHTMVLHGRYICKAIKPDCANCPVAQWCEAKDKRV